MEAGLPLPRVPVAEARAVFGLREPSDPLSAYTLDAGGEWGAGGRAANTCWTQQRH